MDRGLFHERDQSIGDDEALFVGQHRSLLKQVPAEAVPAVGMRGLHGVHRLHRFRKFKVATFGQFGELRVAGAIVVSSLFDGVRWLLGQLFITQWGESLPVNSRVNEMVKHQSVAWLNLLQESRDGGSHPHFVTAPQHDDVLPQSAGVADRAHFIATLTRPGGIGAGIVQTVEHRENLVRHQVADDDQVLLAPRCLPGFVVS